MPGNRGKRTLYAQRVVQETNKRQRQYVLDRLQGMGVGEAALKADISGSTSDRYEDMVEVARLFDGLDELDSWWHAWLMMDRGAISVPARAHQYLVQKRKAERKAERKAAGPKPIGPQGGPSPVFATADVPARASLATIDDLRTSLAQWRGRARAVYTLVSTPEFMETFERLLDDVITISNTIQRIMEILDAAPDEEDA